MYNERLNKLFKLSNKVSVYIPATCDVNTIIDNEKYVDEALTILSNCFGGATRINTCGAWVSDQLGLVKENTTLIYSNASDEDLKNKIDNVLDFCERLKTELKQEAIALEINNEMYFI